MRSGATRATAAVARSVDVAAQISVSTAKRARHIHEFMALGETQPSLTGPGCKRLSWVDLTASRSPVLFINHTSEASQNAKFMSSTQNNLSYLVATQDIPPYTEILTSYMEHLDNEVGGGSNGRIPKKQKTNKTTE